MTTPQQPRAIRSDEEMVWATVHPHPKQPSSTSPPARPMVPRLGEIVMSRILAAQKPISASLRRQFVGGEPS